MYFGYGVFITQRRSLEKLVKVMIRAAMGRYQERAHIYRKVERGRLLDGGIFKNFRWRGRGVLDRAAVGYGRRLVERSIN